MGGRNPNKGSQGRGAEAAKPPRALTQPRKQAAEDPVFLSFSSDDDDWVGHFKRFLKRGIDRDVLAYNDPGKSLPFGYLNNWIDRNISRAPAFFAFLSKSYMTSRACRQEFNVALAQFLDRKLVFVPVLMDEYARRRWNRLVSSKTYKSHLKEYMYFDFVTDAGTEEEFYMEIDNLHGVLRPAMKQKMQSCATFLDSEMRRRRAEIRAGVLADQASRAGRAAAAAAPVAAGASAAAEVPADTAVRRARPARSLVLLGDPTHSPPDRSIGANYKKLVNQLTKEGVAFQTWPHAWRNKADPKDKVRPPATFLRVANQFDIADEARTQATIGWINDCGRVDGTVDGEVVLWWPSEERISWELEAPKLRQDSADALARWLSNSVKRGKGDELPFLLVIDEPDYGAVENAPYWDVVKMVSQLAKVPLPGKAMNAEQFKDVVEKDRHRKLIVAILDTNANMSDPDPLETFEQSVEDWQIAIERINKEKKFAVEVVWVAVMCRLAHLNPVSTWNKKTGTPIEVLRVLRNRDSSAGPAFIADQWSASRVADSITRLMNPRAS